MTELLGRGHLPVGPRGRRGCADALGHAVERHRPDRRDVALRESLRVTFPAACGVACSRQRARRLAHHHTRTAHRLLSKYPAPWGGVVYFARTVTCRCVATSP